ncbi:MAG: glycoside hydrolase family 3 C-terminal domain-containing protein [Prevotella sp.]|nr:glycoside hydrolase family 3 C-terminal domain-containing protein [Prevotella sp.]
MNRKLFRRLLVCVLCLCGAGAASAQRYDFQDTRLADDERIDLLLGQLTLDEKIHLLTTDLGVERLGIPSLDTYEGLHGLALGGPAFNNGKRTEHGVEVPDDLPTTMFPQSYGLGCTWDPTLLQRIGDIEAEEARYYVQQPAARRKGLVLYAPNADLGRDPRWGRTEECFGEDPCLTAQLTVAMVRGLQGNDPRYWKTAALMKHFLANSNEDGRDSTSSNFDERLFREYYSFPFYQGITRGGSRAMMASYNAWNGTPMCLHPCLQQVVRDEWGNNGIICTDGFALTLLVEAHQAVPTRAEGVAAIVKNRVGQILDRSADEAREALAKGLLTEADIDRAIRGNLYVALKLGLLDGPDSANPYSRIGRDSTVTPPFERQDVHEFVREVTAKSVVLLKNESLSQGEGALLPLDATKLKTVAVIGPYAGHIIQDWYSGTPPYEVTILQALREEGQRAGFNVLYAPNNRMGEAEDIARRADVAIVCTGNHPFGTKADWKFCPVPSDGREAVDRQSLTLPDEDLVRLVRRANPRTVLALVSSFPYAITWSQEHLPAIVHLTHCSQEQGHGLADVLFGRVSPAGRTTQTWVSDITELPPMMDYDIRHGRTYMYYGGTPLYPFGHGLSYTTFAYGQARLLKCDDRQLQVVVPVTNTGACDGDEVVQLYVSYPSPAVEQPARQLKAFERVHIRRGQTVDVVLTVDRETLSHWDVALHRFVQERGPVRLLMGASSADIRTQLDVQP